uniref:Uncharacterized protein n=1 Tax=Rhizophora mucronata TaxID=61149 RepID=A0A2P2J9X9_RHIMU
MSQCSDNQCVGLLTMFLEKNVTSPGQNFLGFLELNPCLRSIYFAGCNAAKPGFQAENEGLTNQIWKSSLVVKCQLLLEVLRLSSIKFPGQSS